jgi:hypothetical protein
LLPSRARFLFSFIGINLKIIKKKSSENLDYNIEGVGVKTMINIGVLGLLDDNIIKN